MKYIVTGGAGFIGSHIVEELANRQHEVIILDNLFSGKQENIEQFLSCPGVTFVKGSITNPRLLKETFAGADGVFHLGAIASVPRSVADPTETHDVNLTGTLNVLIAARDCNVKKVIFSSTAAIYGNNPALPKSESMIPETQSPYAVTKIAGEQYGAIFSHLYGVKTVSLRYFNVFGPRQDPTSPYSGVISRFIKNILTRQPLEIYGDGKQTRDFVFVKDVVRANLLAIESSAEGSFNIACGKRIDLTELAAIVMEITGITVPIIFKPPREGDIRDSLADITRARYAFGYEPEYTVKSGLEKTVAWYKSQL
ncbi:SDR family oxidoreductase [uncultured Methanoregula sp.]|uniref:SDR family oxidoreductase n=1 Tax=uncultured Methanoregula sp. TaxID=1005933 RepID=UPI002AAB828A|nr:SDR family oxidoreductase [uncultured Methanoregula sp.]